MHARKYACTTSMTDARQSLCFPVSFAFLCRSVCDISICVLAPIALQVERVCTRCCPSPSACSSPSSPRATSRKLRKRRSTMPILSETPVVAAAAAARDDRSSVYMSANVYIMCESASPPNGCCGACERVCVSTYFSLYSK